MSSNTCNLGFQSLLEDIGEVVLTNICLYVNLGCDLCSAFSYATFCHMKDASFVSFGSAMEDLI